MDRRRISAAPAAPEQTRPSEPRTPREQHRFLTWLALRVASDPTPPSLALLPRLCARAPSPHPRTANRAPAHLPRTSAPPHLRTSAPPHPASVVKLRR